jgi:hypothetical protein
VERQICIHALAAEAAEKAHFEDDAYEVDASKSVRAHLLVTQHVRRLAATNALFLLSLSAAINSIL